MMYELENNINDEYLVQHLKLVEKLKGPIIITDTAKKIYHDWYTAYYTTPGHEDKTGTYERVGDSALKIAGLLSLAKDVSMEINPDQVLAGITAAEKLVNSAKQVTFTINEEETISTLKKKVLKILLKRSDHKITRMNLLQSLHGVMNADDLNKIIETLEQGGLLVSQQVGQHVIYTMPDNIVKKLHIALGGD